MGYEIMVLGTILYLDIRKFMINSLEAKRGNSIT